MNIVRRVTVAAGDRAPWFHGCALGRCCAGVDVMGDDFWCRHLVAMRGAEDRMEGPARVRLRRAARGIVIEAIIASVCEIGMQRFEFAQWRCLIVWQWKIRGSAI
jgi:hypothetical protein